MRRQQFSIPQQYMVGEVKINTEAQLDTAYLRLLLDAFVPFQEAMLAYLDELIAKHDPQRVKKQLGEAEKQNKKISTEWKQMLHLLGQAGEAEQEKIVGRWQDLQIERSALHQTTMELREKVDIESHSQTIVHRKKEDIVKLLQRRQEMIEEGAWEKIGAKGKTFYLFSLIGDDSYCFEFSKISLQASPLNDIFDWMRQYHPESLPAGDPFLTPPEESSVPEKKERPAQPATEFLNIPDEVTASIRTFLAIRRPGYTLLSLLDRSSDEKRAWLAHLTRTLHDETIECVSDVIIELEPHQYMTIQNVQDPLALQQSPGPHAPS